MRKLRFHKPRCHKIVGISIIDSIVWSKDEKVYVSAENAELTYTIPTDCVSLSSLRGLIGIRCFCPASPLGPQKPESPPQGSCQNSAWELGKNCKSRQFVRVGSAAKKLNPDQNIESNFKLMEKFMRFAAKAHHYTLNWHHGTFCEMLACTTFSTLRTMRCVQKIKPVL